MGRKLIVTIFIFALCFFTIDVLAADDLSISQIDVDMPEVKVYLNGTVSEEEADEAEIYMGRQKLTVEGMGTAEEEGIYYYILLDISASIKDAYFMDIKEGISEFARQLRPEDGISLITFGDEVTQITDSADEVRSLLSTIDNDNQNTHLFEAIDMASGDAQRKEDYQRKVIIAVTDGEDFTLGQTTANEALKNLEQRSIPLYAVVVSDTEREYINSFGEFARNSGGNIWILELGSCTDVLHDMRGAISGSSYFICRADSNKVSNESEKLILSFPNRGVSYNKDVLVAKWKKDVTPPEITEVQKISDNELKIVFNEKVINAEQIAAWSVSWNQNAVPVQSVTREADQERTIVILSFSQTLYEGNYVIEGIDIKDDSQEQNLLRDAFSIELEGETYKEKEEDSYILFYILVFAVIFIVVAAVITGCILYRKIRKNKGVIYIEGKPILASNVEKHEKAGIIEPEGKNITLLVDADGKHINKINTVIDRSLFIGRSPINNYYFDDASLSRQHFVLEYENSNMFVSDLNSANKTKVNGIPIYKKRKLEQGDVITAGRLSFRVKW